MVKRRRSVASSDVNESEGERSITPSSSQHAKRACVDKWSFPDELKSATHLCQKLYEFIRKAKDDENHLLCEHLIRVPSRRTLPQYYDVIKTPIDLMRIQQKLKTEEYSYVHDFLSDVKLLMRNVRLFYEERSDEVMYVDELETMFTEKLQEYAHRFSSTPVTTPSDKSPPSFTLRISKDHIQGLSSSKSTSLQVHLRTKVTRSKAWLHEYILSNEPLKMFFAAVYEHTDPTGVCVAEVFHELPSAKDYPEYYEIITEPIDLHLIKKNLEECRYSNLKDIQEDMILMIKNAHHFNEPGSDIYKFASTLRKFVINHCAELERKYHTVIRPLKVSLKRPSVGGEGWEEGGEEGSEDKKIPKLKVKLGSDHEVKKGSSSTSDAGSSGRGVKLFSQSSRTSDDSESDSSEEESSQSEDEEEEEGGRQTVKKLKITRQGKEEDDDLTKLLKSRGPPPLKKQALALYNHLVHHTDQQGRQIAELFMKKPSAKQYPEYYLIIQSPIDFREISQKIKQDQYGSLDDLMKDIELLVSNAMTFNEEDSTVYQDGLVLQKLAREASSKLKSAWLQPSQSTVMTSLVLPSPVATSVATTTITPQPRPRGRPRKNVGVSEMGGVSQPIQSPISSLFMAIKMYTLQGRGLWRSLQNQPTVGSEARRDFSTISMKIATGKFANVHQLYQDLHHALDHVCQTQPSDSLLHRDAVILCRVAAKKYLDLTTVERETGLYPNIQEAVQNMLMTIMNKTMQCSDAECLRDVVVTREIPADGDEPPTTHKVSLTLLEKWVGRGCYRRLDSLQNDLLSVLRFAAEQDKKLCHKAMSLGRVYLQSQDIAVGKNGSNRLWSPALSYTQDDLEKELSEKLTLSGEGVGLVTKATDVVNMVTVDHNQAMPDTDDLCDQLTISDNTYSVGDVVYLSSRNAGQKHHIVLIEKLWKDSSGDAWFQGCWYYRPEETFHLATRKFYEKEVFKSDFHSVGLLRDIHRQCCVLVIRDYVKYSAAEFNEEDLFVCESRYAHKAKSFKKIKNWSYPSGRQPMLITRNIPLVLSRVPSVFMTQSTRVTGSGSHSVVPVSDTVSSKNKELVSTVDGVEDPSLPYMIQLENVKTTVVSNPTAGCTYYEQYCIDEDMFRLGDCVYVRSDQERPFIARIDRMWTDINGDPWFHGPWFVYPEEVTHTPTRLFLERELFMSSIHDTNPMRSIIGRCSVMSLVDYVKKRLTEFVEDDVFVVESRYQEAEGEIRRIVKMSDLKLTQQLSKGVQEDEIFYFSSEIQPLRLPSSKLLTHVISPVTSSPGLGGKSISISSQPSSGRTTPAAGGQVLSGNGSLSTPTGVPQPTNVVSINPQLLQALLASVSQTTSTSNNKPVILPLQQSPALNSTSLTASIASAHTPQQQQLSTISTPVVAGTSTKLETSLFGNKSNNSQVVNYACMWDQCGERFETLTDLTTHLMLNVETTHLVRDMDGSFYCRWANCPRNPRHGGRTFDAMPKITRHVKEVHLLKLSQTALGLNPRSHVIQGQVLRPPTPSVPSPTLAPIVALSSFSIPPNIPSTPLPIAHIPIVPLTSTITTPSNTPSMEAAAAQSPMVTNTITTSVTSSSQSKPTTTAGPLKVSSILIPPPENRKPLIHSAIYSKYIEGLQKGSHYSSSLETTDKMKPDHRPSTTSQIQVSDWLLPSAIPPDMSTTDALVTLRDHLLRDSLTLGQYLEHFQ